MKNPRDKSSLLFRAVRFAVAAHDGQARKATKMPYVVHPLNVGRILVLHGFPDSVVAAGILHDTIEDTPATFEDIEKGFGITIAEIVAGVSEPRRQDPWEKRKKDYLASLKSAPMECLAVACADKIDNLSSILGDQKMLGDLVWDKFHSPRENQAWYYSSVRALLEKYDLHPPLNSLFIEFQEVFLRVFPENR